MSETSNTHDGRSGACPRCGQSGRPVSALTVESLVTDGGREKLTVTEGLRFCATSSCDVAYFHPGSGELVLQRDVRVPIFQKRSTPNRLVCYCFGHTFERVQAEVRGSGLSRILEDIKAKCGQGLDQCERTNPQGSCCLGNVQRVVREVGGRSVPPSAEDSGCCCH